MHDAAVTIKLINTDPREYSGNLLVYLVEENITDIASDAGKLVNRALQQVSATGDSPGTQVS